ncbi:MAG: ankyrin repeat domain-containing protein, partial [Bryobacteraceae bacterium]
ALAHGAVPDGAVADNQPLLNNLIRWGRFSQALWLLSRGASPNIPDERGWTAVHQAASRGNERMLRALLDAGGDRTRRDKEGCVPRDRAHRDGLLAMLARGG